MRKASITVFPVTEMVSSGTDFAQERIPSCRRRREVKRHQRCRKLSIHFSGNGDQMLPVRSPASTWPIGMRR